MQTVATHAPLPLTSFKTRSPHSRNLNISELSLRPNSLKNKKKNKESVTVLLL